MRRLRLARSLRLVWIVFPILLFALFSTSPQFVFGVDAAPAALVGSALLGMGIESGSAEAMSVVPVLTFWVAVWLLVFSLLGAGKLVNYISAPVMGGFITGICTTIILMQAPKLLGGSAGTGELPGIALAFMGKPAGIECAVSALGTSGTVYPFVIQEDHAKVSYGSGLDGAWRFAV